MSRSLSELTNIARAISRANLYVDHLNLLDAVAILVTGEEKVQCSLALGEECGRIDGVRILIPPDETGRNFKLCSVHGCGELGLAIGQGHPRLCRAHRREKYPNAY